MALYKQGNLLQRSQSQAQGAYSAMGKMTPENQTTEYTPGSPNVLSIAGQGMSLLNLPGQIQKAYDNVASGVDWVAGKLGVPNAAAQPANTGAGAQAVKDMGSGIGEAAQLNTGAQVSAQELQNFFYENPAQNAVNAAVTSGEGIGAETAGQTANAAAQAAQGSQAAASGLSGMGAVVAPAIGGVGGGLAGREIGKAIGGETGAAIGGVAGSLGGAYLGGLAGSAMGLGGGAAAGAAAGATAGSAVPGLGTLVGAGIGALTSFFL